MSHPRASTACLLLPLFVVAAFGCGDEKVDSDSAGPSTGGPATVTVGPGPGGGDASGGGSPGTGGGGAGPGAGGAGGAATGGASSTSTASGIPDECGEPGGCAGDQPTECGSNACDAPELYFICEGTDDEPAAYKSCLLAEKLYRTGVWARFIDCLRDGDPDAQCNDGAALVAACVASTVAAACANEGADAFCEAMADSCAAEAQPFAVDACKADLVPFGENGLQLYAECIDLPEVEGLCNRTHQECFDEYAP